MEKVDSQIRFKIDAHHLSLVNLRQAKGLGQYECAKQIGISQTNYGFIERCMRSPTEREAQKIADYFKVDVHDLFPKEVLAFSTKWGEIDKVQKEKIVDASELRIADIPNYLELPAPEDEDTIYDEADQFWSAKRVEKLMAQCSPKEKDVLMFRYGFGVYKQPHTLEEAGKHFGVTRERIRQIEAKAMERMRTVGVSPTNTHNTTKDY